MPSPARPFRPADVFDPSNLLWFLLGSVALGVAGSSAYELITRALGRSTLALVIMFIVALLGLFPVLLVARVAARRLRWVRGGLSLDVDADRDVTPRRGLIVFVSTGSNKSDRDAIDHHIAEQAGRPVLERCWLVYTTAAESHKNALAIQAEYQMRYRTKYDASDNFQIYALPDAYDIRVAFETVMAVIDQARQGTTGLALTADDLIVDVTGGTKMMTAGAVLACLRAGIEPQYMKPYVDPQTHNPDYSRPARARKAEIAGLEPEEPGAVGIG